MDDELKQIGKLLAASKKIAVVGISKNPYKTSRQIADFLVSTGFEVVGVNPNFNFGVGDVKGIKIFPKLTNIPFSINIVNVFRSSKDIPELIDDILAVKPKALWLQLGIRNDEAVKPVIDNGITVIQDKCIMVYYNLVKQYQS